MSGDADLGKSLNQLLGWTSGQPPYPTSLVGRGEAALATPLEDLTLEQIRLLVSQQFGLEPILPLAYNAMFPNPLVSVTFYDGDLLCACLRVKSEFWQEHPELWDRLHEILESLDRALEGVNEHRPNFLAGNPYGARL